MYEALNQEAFLAFMVNLWVLWSSRRKAMYEDIFQTPFTINSFVTSYIAELKSLQQPGVVVRGPPQRRPNHWIAPPDGLVKLNVDAAVG